MRAAHLALAVILSGTVASFTDWFFGGVLFHDKYLAHPEIWRRSPGQSETKAIAWSVVLGYFTCTVFVLLAHLFEASDWQDVFAFAIGIWLMVAVPMLITNALFIKMHPLTVVGHALGWLAKLLIAAAFTVWLVIR